MKKLLRETTGLIIRILLFMLPVILLAALYRTLF
nr:MAG TPA: hypothetical protein [Caudoviricetes sp.]